MKAEWLKAARAHACLDTSSWSCAAPCYLTTDTPGLSGISQAPRYYAPRRKEDCDGLSLMWRLHQHANPAKLPRQRTVVHLTLTGAGAAEGWLDIARAAVTVCTDDPGYDVDLAIEADTGQMQRWLVGLVPFRDLIASGHARMLGPSRLARAFPTWFDTTYFTEGLHRAEQRRSQQAIPGQDLTA